MSPRPAVPTLRLLDTNIISELMRHPVGKVAAQLQRLAQEQPDGKICTSAVVDCELQFGVARKGSVRLADAYGRAMSVIEIRDLPASAAPIYADIRAHLERLGKPIGANDLLIAAHALALEATLVTDNEDEFRRVPGLSVENWLNPALEHE